VKRDPKAPEIRKAEILDAGADLLIDQGDGPCETGVVATNNDHIIKRTDHRSMSKRDLKAEHHPTLGVFGDVTMRHP
jgi:hypothetical protein